MKKENKLPEIGKMLPLETAFNQIASWLEITKEKVEENFAIKNIEDFLFDQRFKEDKPVYIKIEQEKKYIIYCRIYSKTSGYVIAGKRIENIDGGTKFIWTGPKL